MAVDIAEEVGVGAGRGGECASEIAGVCTGEMRGEALPRMGCCGDKKRKWNVEEVSMRLL